MERKIKTLAAILVVAIVVGAGLWVVLSSNNENESVTLYDALGRAVTIEDKPSTIVSVSPAITEMIYALGEGDNLVGVTEYCDYPANVTERIASGDLVTVGGYYYDIDEELIIHLNPDVVFLEASVSDQVALATKLEQANINAVVLYTAANSSMVMDNIELIGKALHEEYKSTALENSMKTKFDAIADKVAESDHKPSIMLVVWWDTTSIWVAGDGSFADEIIESAGAVNAFDNKDDWASIGPEDVVAADPDIIILCAMSMGDVNQAVNELKDPLYSSLNATTYTLLGQADNAFLRQSVRIVEATYICAMMAHPEEFDKVLPNNLGDNYTEYLPSDWSSS